MSVQENHYVMIGHKFEYDAFYKQMEDIHGLSIDDFWDQFEESCHDSAFQGIHHNQNVCIISDGMDGEYVYVGYVLQKSKNYGNLTDYINPVTKSPEQVSRYINDYLKIPDLECQLHAFTHYR